MCREIEQVVTRQENEHDIFNQQLIAYESERKRLARDQRSSLSPSLALNRRSSVDYYKKENNAYVMIEGLAVGFAMVR